MDTWFEVNDIPQKGLGVFALRPFAKDELVMRGVIARTLRENCKHASQVGPNTFVLHAGLVPLVNHSCDPTCGIRPNQAGAHDFIAMRSIGVGDEITFDYALRNYAVEYFHGRCRCGSPMCRGTIGGWSTLPDDRKKKYKGYCAPYLLDFNRNQANTGMT